MTTRILSLRVLLVCLIPITLWAFCFFLIYGAETLACVPPIRAARSPNWVAIIASLAVATGAVVFAARRSRFNGDRDEAQSFLAKTSAELAILAALAAVWIVLAAATIPLCVAPS